MYRVIQFVKSEKHGIKIRLNNVYDRLCAMLGISFHSIDNLTKELKEIEATKESSPRMRLRSGSSSTTTKISALHNFDKQFGFQRMSIAQDLTDDETTSGESSSEAASEADTVDEESQSESDTADEESASESEYETAEEESSSESELESESESSTSDEESQSESESEQPEIRNQYSPYTSDEEPQRSNTIGEGHSHV